jgi:hypothetical protein
VLDNAPGFRYTLLGRLAAHDRGEVMKPISTLERRREQAIRARLGTGGWTEDHTAMVLGPLIIGGMCLFIAAPIVLWLAPLFVIAFR